METDYKKFEKSNNLLIKHVDECIDDFNGLYPDITISTTTITCSINVNFNIENIGCYFDDFDEYLIDKKYGDRSSTDVINRYTNNNTTDTIFNNQISFIFNSDKLCNIKTLDNKDPKKICVKFFPNGSIQMTGCNNFVNIKKCLLILFEKLKIKKIIELNGITKEIIFVSNPDELKLENIYDFNVRMINFCFDQKFNINRQKLNELLKQHKYDSNFNQINASVIIKYPINNSVVTIFVFQSGRVTISGPKSIATIMEAYYFINNFILTYYI